MSAASGSAISESDKSTIRIAIALLVSALFLQRFSAPFKGSVLELDFLSSLFLLMHQFIGGKLFIRYDRLSWFIAVGLAVTCSLLLNFNTAMLPSYFLFIILYSLFTLSRRSTPDAYKKILYGFQFLVMVLSCVAALQFPAQFVLDGRKLILFYGIVPDYLLGLVSPTGSPFGAAAWNTIHTIEGSWLLKSNGIFLVEPSALSQITALGILIEVLEFRRPLYLLCMALGFLVAYSGTGAITLILFLPLVGLRNGKAGLSALLVLIFALGLFATGIIDLSVFVSRATEFEDTRTSGFQRFISPFWLAATYFDTVSLQALLVGNGPGTAKGLDSWYGGSVATWLKMLYEYGIFFPFIFVCFLASCFRKSSCPGPVLAALLFTCVFYQTFLSTWLLTIIMVLCTLHGTESRRGRIDEASPYGQFLAARSAAI
jgi:hypothetical protein